MTLTDIRAAQQRIAPHLTLPTLLEPAPELGEQVFLKLENTNPTHSFKIRGALNAVLALSPAQRARGLIAASSGNHAQALARAAQLSGARARILMPLHTPRRKIRGVLAAGAEPVLFGDTYDAAEAEARRLAAATGETFVSPYNDPAVIAGAGTVGLELIAQLPDLGRVVVCAGGGGLISGIATAVKALRPQVEVVAACALHAPQVANLLTGGALPQVWETLAEALSGEIEAGSVTIPIIQQLVDRAVLVDEDQIAVAIGWLLDVQGWLVEGGGAVGVAALRAALLPPVSGPTAVVVSGGNIDPGQIRHVLQVVAKQNATR